MELGAVKREAPSSARDLAERIVCRSPSSGEVIAEVPVCGPEEVRAAVARAREAQASWAPLPIRERARLVRRFRDALVDRLEEVVALMGLESGKPRIEVLGHEVMTLADAITYFAKNAPRILKPRPLSLHMFPHRRSYVHYVPRGVVAVIGPWNYPLNNVIYDVPVAALAGNAVVVKPSEYTPLAALKARDIWVDAGLPEGLFQVVTGYGATGAALVEAGVDKVVFVGSVATGRKIARACGERLIPCTLELGGKAPAIVCADADLERTANALTWGAFANAGQICASVERVYAVEAVHDRLVEMLAERARALRQGDPTREEVDVGPIVFPKQLRVAREHVDDAVSRGARVLAGGQAPDRPGQFFAPTVLAGVQQDMACMREETFGPLLPVMKVRDESEALRLANDSHLGLTAYVFTRDVARGRRLAEQVRSGTVMVNDVLATHAMPETPWAGVKQSGLGRVHSDDGMRDMCETRHVNHDRLPWTRREQWWYPYNQGTYDLLRRAIRGMFRSGGLVARLRAATGRLPEPVTDRRRILPRGATPPPPSA